MSAYKLSRRSFLSASAAGAIAAASPFRSFAAGEDMIVRYGARGGILGDIVQKQIVDPFTAATGIQVKNVAFPEMAKVKAMVETNTLDVDIWESDAKAMEILGRRGLLEPIDYSLLRPTIKSELLPGMTPKFGVAQAVFGLGICYNTDKFSKANHPRSWAEFWDVTKFPGPRTLPDASNDITAMEAALLADGVPADKLYPMDVDRAFKSLDRIKPHVVKFFSKSAEGLNLLTSKTAVLGGMTFGRIIATKNEDSSVPLDIDFGEALVKPFYFVIPKGAKYAANAHKMIDYYMKAENLGRFTNAYPAYGPANPKAIDYVEPKNRVSIITAPQNAATLVFLKDDWWTEEDAAKKSNTEKVMERWVAWAR